MVSIHTARVPGGVNDCWRLGISKGLVRNMCVWDVLAALKLPVSKFKGLNACHSVSALRVKRNGIGLSLCELLAMEGQVILTNPVLPRSVIETD